MDIFPDFSENAYRDACFSDSPDQFIIGFYKLAVLIRYDITAAMEKFVQRNMVIAAELDCCIKIRKPSAGLIAGIYLSGDMKFFAECACVSPA